MAATFITEKDLKRRLWIPFSLAETRLQPGIEQPVSLLRLQPGQIATLAWLTIHLIRINVLTAVPTKINQGYNAVYAGLFGNNADTLGGAPGEPLAYAGADLPGTVGVYPPYSAWPIEAVDTYAIFAVNNLSAPPADVTVTGAWLIHTS